MGIQDKLYLGNLDSKRDWGHAKDYVNVMWMILQYQKADDWVISSGKTLSVREFVKLAFKHIGIVLDFRGKGLNEKAYVLKCESDKYKLKIGKEVLCIDPKYFRPTEVELLIGDSSKAVKELGWKSNYSVEDLVFEMMEHDLNNIIG